MQQDQERQAQQKILLKMLDDKNLDESIKKVIFIDCLEKTPEKVARINILQGLKEFRTNNICGVIKDVFFHDYYLMREEWFNKETLGEYIAVFSNILIERCPDKRVDFLANLVHTYFCKIKEKDKDHIIKDLSEKKYGLPDDVGQRVKEMLIQAEETTKATVDKKPKTTKKKEEQIKILTKFEPIRKLTRNDLYGFECLAIGKRANNYIGFDELKRELDMNDLSFDLECLKIHSKSIQSLPNNAEIVFTVNISKTLLKSIGSMRLPKGGRDVLESFPKGTIFEITEKIDVQEIEDVKALYKHFRERYRFGIDDLHGENSSVAILVEHKEDLKDILSYYKLDHRIFTKWYGDPTGIEIAEGVIEKLLAGWDKGFIAEGIENSDHKEFLKKKQKGKDYREIYIQGYGVKLDENNSPDNHFLKLLETPPNLKHGYILKSLSR